MLSACYYSTRFLSLGVGREVDGGHDRNKDSVSGVTQVMEYTTNLPTWTEVPIPEAGAVTITPGRGHRPCQRPDFRGW